MSALSLAYHKQGKSKYNNRGVYVMRQASINNLAALVCTPLTD